MCGIVGYFSKHGADQPVGSALLAMLTALARRGPDSAGVALFGPGEPRGEICWIKLPEDAAPEESEAIALQRLATTGRTLSFRRDGSLLRALLERDGTVQELCDRVERDGSR